MSVITGIKALVELAVVLLLIYGFIHEQDVIAFEQLLKEHIKFELKKRNNNHYEKKRIKH